MQNSAVKRYLSAELFGILCFSAHYFSLIGQFLPSKASQTPPDIAPSCKTFSGETSFQSKIYDCTQARMHIDTYMLPSHNRLQEAGVFTCLEGGTGRSVLGRDEVRGWRINSEGEGGRKLDLRRGENRDGSDGGRDDELLGQEEREADGEEEV